VQQVGVGVGEIGIVESSTGAAGVRCRRSNSSSDFKISCNGVSVLDVVAGVAVGNCRCSCRCYKVVVVVKSPGRFRCRCFRRCWCRRRPCRNWTRARLSRPIR